MADTSSDTSQQDCIACRLTGGGAFTGVGGYLLWEGRQLPLKLKARRTGLRITGLGRLIVRIICVSAFVVITCYRIHCCRHLSSINVEANVV
jgi:hypothetical protein